QGAPFVPVALQTSVLSPAGVNWLTLTNAANSPFPNNSTTSGTSIYAHFDPTGLPAGTYSATITVTPSGGAAVNIPVTFRITTPTSPLSVNPESLTFTYLNGVSDPASQSLTVTQHGASQQPVSVGFARGSSWLSVTTLKPFLGGNVLVTVSPA